MLGTDTLVVRSATLRPGRSSLRAQAGSLRRVPSQYVQLRGGDTLYWNLRTRVLRQSP